MTGSTETVLEGEIIRLRYLDEDDATPVYAGWMNAPEINRFLESRFAVQTVDTVRDFIRAARDNEDVHLFGMFLRRDGRHVGNIKLGPIDRRHGTADVGLLVGAADVWGQGVATDAIALVARFATGPLGLRRVTAGAYARNAGCIRAFEKAGFVREGVLRRQVIGADGVADDVIKLGVLAEELAGS